MKTVSPGIRQKDNGKFIATKSIGKKRYYQEFDREVDARKWKKNFHPLLSSRPVRNRNIFTASDQSNGIDKSINFAEVIEKYQKEFLRTLSAYTQYKKLLRLSNFTHNIQAVPMCTMRPEVITNHLDAVRLLIPKESQRCNFDKELKDIASIFNWYKTIDFTFVNPVIKTHYRLGKIKDIQAKQKDMDMDEFVEFVAHLSPMFQSMAIIMLLWAMRVGEAAALSDDVINYKKKEAFICNVVTWMRGRPDHKKGTKTGADAKMRITDTIEVELRKLQANRPKGCKYFFHHKGKLLRYGMILNEFNRALKKAELPYSGTHVIRHTMATIARKDLGLDAAQAILRHTSARMSEEYAKLDVNERASEVVIEASNLFRSAKKRATDCDQRAISS
jgi:integrase